MKALPDDVKEDNVNAHAPPKTDDPHTAQVDGILYTNEEGRWLAPCLILGPPSPDIPGETFYALTMQTHKVLGPYLVGVKLTRREQVHAWYAVALMFFVVLVPTLNSTILAYFTKQVRPCLVHVLLVKFLDLHDIHHGTRLDKENALHSSRRTAG